MEIKVGQKIRGSEIVWVSEDKRVFGVYSPNDLGKKGTIWGKCHFQKLSEDDIEDFRNVGILVRKFFGVYYMVLDRVDDYPAIFTECRRLVTDPASVFSQPEPLVFET